MVEVSQRSREVIMGAGGIIIIKNAAKQLRAEARAKTLEAHGWLGTKWIEFKALWGFHG